MLKEGSRKFVCFLALSVAVVGMVFAGGANESSAAKKMTIQIGFENSMSEPVGQALKKW